MTRRLVPLVVFLLAVSALAEEEGQEHAGVTAADAVLASVGSGPEGELEALAARDDPDPWIVADELLGRGEVAAALAFAKAAPRKDTDALPAYLESRRGAEAERETREAFSSARAALIRGEPSAALEAGAVVDDLPLTVSGLRLTYGDGLALRQLGRLEESASRFLEAARGAERIGWLRRAARSFGEAGHSAYQRSDWRIALEAWEERLRVDEDRRDRVSVARTLGNLGIVHLALGEEAKALSVLERALALKETLGDEQGAARALGNIGVVHESLGEWRSALQCYERSLGKVEAIGDRQGVAAALANLGNVHFRLGDWTQALSYQTRALALMDALGDRAGAANVLGNIGNVRALGDHVAALSALERAFEVQGALGDRGQMAATLQNIGLVHQARADYSKALACYERCREVYEALGSRRSVAGVLSSIGVVHYRLGDLDLALSFQGRALEAQEALGDRMAAAETLQGIGLTRLARGEYAKALSALERALHAQEALGDPAAVAATLGNLGLVHEVLGDYRRALSLHGRALEVKKALGHRSGAALTLGNLGIVHLRLGDHARALSCYEEALASAKRRDDRALAAGMLGNIANVHQVLGDYRSALSLQEGALAAQEALGDRIGAARTMGSIGNLYHALGDDERALAGLRRAVRSARRLRARYEECLIAEDLARRYLEGNEAARALMTVRDALEQMEFLVGGLAEEQGARAREQFAGLFAAGALAAALLEQPADALTLLENGRAGSLLETLGGGSAVRFTDLPAKLIEAEVDAKAVEARARWEHGRAQTSGNRREIRKTARAVDEAMEVRREVAARIQREAKRVAGVFYPRAATLEEIQGWMEPGMALVVYGLCLDEALALVVTSEAERIVSLGTVKDVEAACVSLVCDAPDTTPADAFATLRTLLVEPLALADGAMTVLVSPDGALGYVPWGALFDRPVACVPSGTTWVLLREEEREPGEKILALGDPDYSARPDDHAVAIYTRGGRLTPLPATRDEAKAIGDVVLLGQEASEPALTEALQKEKRWRAVHLACHGLVDPERPMLSSLALTPTAEDDGFLTCLDIFRMQVPADLVTLSACETARGKVYRAEGIVGLTRAFMYAGAPRVLCSLWKVDDEATRALMTKFYELWNPKEGDGLPAAEALRQAQAYVAAQEKWEHPYYWAAWVLWGLAR